MQTDFFGQIKEKTLLFDGAMGTMLLSAGLSPVRNPMVLNTDNSTFVRNVHKRYYDAGADVVITNTFGGSPLKLAADGLAQAWESLNREAVKIARQVCPDGKFVAGDIGPSGKMLKPLGDISVEKMEQTFQRQAGVLIDGGVDFIIIETMYSLDEALAAVNGVRKVSDLLLLVSMTFTKTKNGFFTVMGEDIGQCASRLEKAGVDMIGANCTLGSKDMIDVTRELRTFTCKPILIQPNAGKPVTRKGVTTYEQTPAEFATDAKKIIDAGADMIGGCCGTTPEFIQAIRKMIH